MSNKTFENQSGQKEQTQEETKQDPRIEALIRAIRERSKEDPLVGAKLGAKEVFQRLVNSMKTPKGVHIESLLCALGALAGYSCQANLRAQAVAKSLSESEVFTVVETKDGKKYFFGDPLNNVLAGIKYSVWGLSAATAQQAGCQKLPDLNEMFQYTSTVIGSDKFGLPRVDEKHRAADSPVNYLSALWPAISPTVRLFCPEPSHWPILFGLAIQETITTGKNVIDPCTALNIVMECAIPMSKIDLGSV